MRGDAPRRRTLVVQDRPLVEYRTCDRSVRSGAPCSRPIRATRCRGRRARRAWSCPRCPRALSRRPARDALPGVRTVGIWDARHDQDWGLDWHRNEGIELTCSSAAGCLRHRCGRPRLRPGDLTITRPWQRHRVGHPHVTTGRLHWLILDVGVRRPNQEWRWPHVAARGRGGARALTGSCATTSTRSGPATARAPGLRAPRPRSAGRAARPAHERADARPRRAAGVPRRGRVALATERTVALFLVRLEHELERPWTLDAMAAECGLGRTRFAHYCERLTNLSPREYLSRLRVQRARALLETGELNVTEIAYALRLQLEPVLRDRLPPRPRRLAPRVPGAARAVRGRAASRARCAGRAGCRGARAARPDPRLVDARC